MRRKIQVTTDDSLDATVAPPPAPDASAPEFANHVTPSKDGAQDPPAATADGTRAPGETGARDYITALQAEIEELRQRAEEAEKRVLYTQAEFQNYRRRKEEQDRDLQKYTNSELLKALLPIVDNFERALAAAEQTRNFDALVGGVSGTLKQLQAFLQKAGVTPIEAVGKEFDPRFHEAIGHTESEAYPANTVSEEVQRGYLMHDRVLRPSLVKVSQG